MDVFNEIKQLGEGVCEYLPEPVKSEIAVQANDILKFAVISAGTIVKSFFQKLGSKGINPQEIEQKAEKDPIYKTYISRVSFIILQEQVKEKLDAWAELVFLIHTGQLTDPVNIDLHMKLLQDCTLQDLLVLGEMYRTSDVGSTPIAPESIVGLSKANVLSSMQRLASFGLLDMHFDKRAVWASGEDRPNLSTLYYTRNSIGKEFLNYVRGLKVPQPTL